MIRILITDDHEIIRNSLKHILQEEFCNIEFGEAASGKEALEKVRNEKWDVIIMDVTMPGISCIVTLKQMRKENIQTPVLVMSFNADDIYASRVIKAGASGFISKDNAFQDLIVAIRFLILSKDISNGGQKEALEKVHDKKEDDSLETASYGHLFLNIVLTVKNLFKGVL